MQNYVCATEEKEQTNLDMKLVQKKRLVYPFCNGTVILCNATRPLLTKNAEFWLQCSGVGRLNVLCPFSKSSTKLFFSVLLWYKEWRDLSDGSSNVPEVISNLNKISCLWSAKPLAAMGQKSVVWSKHQLFYHSHFPPTQLLLLKKQVQDYASRVILSHLANLDREETRKAKFLCAVKPKLDAEKP